MVFFDLFNQPLTLFEIYRYLGVKIGLSELSNSLELMRDEIKVKNGFYFLLGREEIVEERFKKYNYFKRKIKIAKKFSQLISLLPFVRGVAVSNIVSNHNLKDGGDIDLLIISSRDRIFLTRFLCTSLAKFLNIRPSKKTKKDKVCLSFYISEADLNLEKCLYSQDDLYFVYWVIGLEIIVNKNGVFDKFQFDNKWVKAYLPNYYCFSRNSSSLSVRESVNSYRSRSAGGAVIFNYLERLSKKMQLKIMPKSLKEKKGVTDGVIFESDIIKLFLEDKRPVFIDRFKKALEMFL